MSWNSAMIRRMIASRRATPTGVSGRDIRSARVSPDSREVAFHVLEPDGTKLSKTRNATPIDPAAAPKLLISTLTYLSQAPPPDLADSSIKDVWNWAVAHWRPQALAGRTEVRLSLPGDSEAES